MSLNIEGDLKSLCLAKRRAETENRVKKMTTPYRIGITGHRTLGDPATVQFVRLALHDRLSQAQREHAEGVIALSGLAEGSDTLFAETALALGIPLEAVIACEGFEEDFPPGSARQRYQHLLEQCQVVHRLPFHERSDDAYLAVGQWIVDHSDLLLAAWNGQSAAGKGGTGDVVAYAQQVGRPVVHIHTTEHTVKLLESTQRMMITNIEEYKLVVEDTARFSERRQIVTNTYITVNSAIAGLITFLIKDSRLVNWWLAVAILPLIGFGIVICSHWRRLITKYKQLVGLRLNVLREMEVEFPGSVQMYHREDALYPRDSQNKPIPGIGLNFSDLEIRLPSLFILLYIVMGLGLAIGTWLVTRGILPSPIAPVTKP